MTSEKDMVLIREEARKVLNEFAEKIDKIDVGAVEIIDGKNSGMREESLGSLPDEDFRKRVFKNADIVKDDKIIMEKKSW